MVALAVAVWSVRLQQRQLAAQSHRLDDQEEEQKEIVESLRVQARALTELVTQARRTRSRAERLERARRYVDWLAALDALSRAMLVEADRQQAAIAMADSRTDRPGVIPEAAMAIQVETQHELRRLRAEVEAAATAIRLIERERALVQRVMQLSRFPEFGPAQRGLKNLLANAHLVGWRARREAHREELEAFIEHIERRLGLTPEWFSEPRPSPEPSAAIVSSDETREDG